MKLSFICVILLLMPVVTTAKCEKARNIGTECQEQLDDYKQKYGKAQNKYRKQKQQLEEARNNTSSCQSELEAIQTHNQQLEDLKKKTAVFCTDYHDYIYDKGFWCNQIRRGYYNFSFGHKYIYQEKDYEQDDDQEKDYEPDNADDDFLEFICA